MGCGTSIKSLSFKDTEVLFYNVRPFKERYEARDRLGKGTFGTVYLATDLITGDEVAVKVLDVQAATDAECRQEIRIWKLLSCHPNIVRFIQVCRDDGGSWNVVMELCQCTVWDKILKSPQWTVQELREDTAQILQGLNHMHVRGYLHRDIKAQNILYGGPNGRTPKIADFGLSTKHPNPKVLLHRVYGSSAYMSPEMIAKHGYDTGTDVWSTGILFYVIFFGQFPFGKLSMDRSEIKLAILEGKKPAGFARRDEENRSPIKQAAVNLVRWMLARPSKARIKITDALQTPFFKMDLPQEELWDFIVKREVSQKRKEPEKKEAEGANNAAVEKKPSHTPLQGGRKEVAIGDLAKKLRLVHQPKSNSEVDSNLRSPPESGRSSSELLKSNFSKDSARQLGAHGLLQSGNYVPSCSGSPRGSADGFSTPKMRGGSSFANAAEASGPYPQKKGKKPGGDRKKPEPETANDAGARGSGMSVVLPSQMPSDLD